MIQSVNHVTYSVSDLERSVEFYRDVLKAEILVEGKKTAYFNIVGL